MLVCTMCNASTGRRPPWFMYTWETIPYAMPLSESEASMSRECLIWPYASSYDADIFLQPPYRLHHPLMQVSTRLYVRKYVRPRQVQTYIESSGFTAHKHKANGVPLVSQERLDSENSFASSSQARGGDHQRLQWKCTRGDGLMKDLLCFVFNENAKEFRYDLSSMKDSKHQRLLPKFVIPSWRAQNGYPYQITEDLTESGKFMQKKKGLARCPCSNWSQTYICSSFQ